MDSGVRESGSDIQRGWEFPEIGRDSLISRLTAEAQSARDAFTPGITFRESGITTEVALPPDRVVEAVDRVSKRMGVYEAYVPAQPARARR